MRKFLLVAALFFAGVASATPSIMVFDLTEKEIAFAYNSDTVRPIASITKLVTAMVALDTYNKSAHTTITDMLVTSNNQAAEALAQQYPGGRVQFINAMNKKVRDMGLVDTRFHDPSGLSVFNSSTATELVVVLYKAMSYSLITSATTTKDLKRTPAKKDKKPIVYAHNTNKRLLERYSNIVVGKTGYTSRAGRCLAVLIKSDDSLFAVVALGYTSPQEREATMVNLINNFTRPKSLNIALAGPFLPS